MEPVEAAAWGEALLGSLRIRIKSAAHRPLGRVVKTGQSCRWKPAGLRSRAESQILLGPLYKLSVNGRDVRFLSRSSLGSQRAFLC